MEQNSVKGVPLATSILCAGPGESRITTVTRIVVFGASSSESWDTSISTLAGPGAGGWHR